PSPAETKSRHALSDAASSRARPAFPASGQLADIAHGKSRIAPQLRRTPGRNDLDPQRRQLVREFRHTGFVIDADQRPLDCQVVTSIPAERMKRLSVSVCGSFRKRMCKIAENLRSNRKNYLETRAFNFTRPPSMLTVYSISRPPFSFNSLVLCCTHVSTSFKLGVVERSPVSVRASINFSYSVYTFSLSCSGFENAIANACAVCFTSSTRAAASAARKSIGGGSTTFAAASAAFCAAIAALAARSASTALAAAPKWWACVAPSFCAVFLRHIS